jgi:hypothetical protein
MMRIVLLLALAAGCAFDTSGLPATPGTPDAAVVADAPAPEPAPDAAVVPDAAPPIDAGGGAIGADCEEDGDCATGVCESAGRGVKQCALACSPDVPCPDQLVCRRGICED